MAVVRRPSKDRRIVRRKSDATEIAATVAARIDRQADHLLHLGHHHQAELLAHRAEAMRTEVAR